MKKIILSICIIATMLVFSSFTNHSDESIEKNTDYSNITVKTNGNIITLNNDNLGTCHIRVYKDGELVHSADLPCNTPQECRDMLKKTVEFLDAME